MTKDLDREVLNTLYREKFNCDFNHLEVLAETGSYRRYYRLFGKDKSILGVINPDTRENEAYISFSKTFIKCGINVPKIELIKNNKNAYLVEDLGDETLYSYAKCRKDKQGYLNKEAIEKYEKSLSGLIELQNTTINEIDTSLCYPRDKFDYQSIIWDLYYFKYYFLKLMRIQFDEQALENNMQSLAKKLDSIKSDAFLFRDFQSRNIIINNNNAYFIDFQGGRKGAIYYDLASILFDANMELQGIDIEKLMKYYYKNSKEVSLPFEEFKSNLQLFAIIRLMQALGAFGLRGVVEKKPNFVSCIPYATASLFNIFTESSLSREYSEIYKAVRAIKKSKYIETLVDKEKR